MNRPNFFTYLIGNGLSFVGLSIGLLVFGFQFLTTGQGGMLALIFLIAGSAAYKANERIRAYNDWQREWNAMDGKAPRQFALPGWGKLRVVLGVIVWIVFGFMALGATGTPGLEIPLAMFWAGTALGIAVAIFRLIKRGKSAPRRGADFVSHCLARPGQSASLNQAYQSLPDYCRRIIG